MTYTGHHDIRLDGAQLRLSALLTTLDVHAGIIGITVDFPEVEQARQLQTRAGELQAAFDAREASGRSRAVAAGAAYAKGDLGADATIKRLIDAAMLTGETAKRAREHLDAALGPVRAEGPALLRSISEGRWLDLLRPIADRHIAAANEVADELDLDVPRPGRPGVRTSQHPHAPTPLELGSLPARHRWERLEEALDRLDQVHAFVDVLRRWGFIPLVPGRSVAEDYRWRRLDRLDGRPDLLREFFVANRHRGEPGIWSSAELAEADQPTPTEAATPTGVRVA